MTTIVTRAGKGSPLTSEEMDTNFSNLDNDKLELLTTTTASASSITPTAKTTQMNLTAMAVGVTVNAPSATPAHGHKMLLRFRDDGSSRSIGWDAYYRAVGVTLPTATAAGKLTYVGVTHNATDNRGDVVAVGTEA